MSKNKSRLLGFVVSVLFTLLAVYEASASPQPQLTISAGASSLLGSPVPISLSMTNTSPTVTDTGYFPILELKLPAGMQCDASCQSSIAYSLPPLAPVNLTVCGGFGSPAGTCTNPVTGEVLTRLANETYLFITLPLGTISVGQPPAQLSVPATMTSGAVIGTGMTVTGRGIFALGASPTGVRGPCGGPNDTICQSPAASQTVTPSLILFSKSTSASPSTATGPTFVRDFDINADIANGASITSITLTDAIPDSIVVTDPPASNCTGSATFTISPAPTTCSYTHDPNGGGNLSLTYANATGGSGAQDLHVHFRGYVQRYNDNLPASPLINPQTADATSSSNTATLNYSYLGNPQPQANANATIAQNSLTSSKSNSVLDNAPSGNSPGDVVTWTVTTYVSDYFSFDDLKIDDYIQDGQTYVPNSFSVRVVEGSSDVTINPGRTSDLLFNGHLVVSPKDGNGETHIALNLSDALVDPVVFAQDGTIQGADTFSSSNSTRVIFSYQTTIDEQYVTVPVGDTLTIDGGDVIANFANIDFQVLGETFREAVNGVASQLTIQPLTVILKAAPFVNGVAPSLPLRIGPPDDVTYKITMVIPTGDLEDFSVSDFLPTPLFQAVDPDANGVNNSFTQIAQGNSAPAAGEWRYTTSSTLTPAASVLQNGGSNSVVWSFGSNVENGASSAQQTIEILFTVRATNRPMANDLQLVNLLSADHGTSSGTTTVNTVAAISTLLTSEPQLTLAKSAHAVVSSSGSVSGDNFINVDSGDVLTFRLDIENTGSRDAYNVEPDDVLPTGLVAPSGGFAYSVVNNGGTSPCDTASFTDASVGNRFHLQNGIVPAGARCRVFFNVQVDSVVRWSQTVTNSASLLFTSQVGGPTFTPVQDTSNLTVRIPTITKSYVLGSSSDPVTADPLLRSNESVTFRFQLNVPEGQGDSLSLNEIDSGTSNPGSDFFKNLSPSDISFAAAIQNTCSNGNPALFNFAGLNSVCFTLDPSLAGNQSQTSSTNYRINFGTVYNFDTNNATTESFTMDVVVKQKPLSPFGTYTNRAQVRWNNGSSFQTATGTATLQVGDPHLTLTKSSLSTPPAKIGDVVRYRVIATNDGTSPAYNVGDIVDTLPAGLSNATLVSATNNGSDVTGVLGFSFSQVGNQVHVTVLDVAAQPQITHGQQFVVVYDVTVQGTRVNDTIVGPGHPGGVVSLTGCVASVANSVDILSFDTGSNQPDTLLDVAPASVSFALDNDGDGIPNSVEISAGCIDTDGDGVPDYLDTDSDDNGVSDTTEYNSGADRDGDGIPDYRDLDNDGDGISDITEINNAGGSNGDFDGDGLPDWLDIDSDNDGVLDLNEGNVDRDGDGRPNYLDRDSDNDGIPDIIEGGGVDLNYDGVADNLNDTDGDGWVNLFDPNNGGTPLTLPDTDGDGIRNLYDIDSDNDGITDLREAGGTDSDGNGRVDGVFIDPDGDGFSALYDSNDGGTRLNPPNSDGTAGADYMDTDSDNDGISDNVEGQPSGVLFIPPTGTDSDGDGLDNAYDPDNGGLPIVPVNTDGVGVPDYRDPDSDNDGIADITEGASDFDSDGVPNYRDLDSDGDLIPDAIEQAIDTDGDTQPDYLDLDSDADGISDSIEGYLDADGDGVSNFRDLDSDNDGVFDSVETNTDSDGDGLPNRIDLDSDNDGIPDVVESGGVDANGDGLPDSTLDSDHDGVLNLFDVSNGGTPLSNVDTDGDTRPNRLDIDSDNDGLTDLYEAGGVDSDGNGRVDGSFIDADGDGFSGRYDSNDGGTSLPRPNTDGIGGADYLDTDSDQDGISDNVESQPTVGFRAPLGVDTDGDGLDNRYDSDNGGSPIVVVNTDNDTAPDFRDLDSDGDLIPDSVEGTGDVDSDGQPNYRDLDSDGDGIPDSLEGTTNGDGDGNGDYLDTDSDGDGILDSVEGITDSDRDGIYDARDLDSDNDGILDSVEGNSDSDGDGIPNRLDLDSDNDGIPDIVESGGIDNNGDGLADNLTDSDHDGLLNLFDPSNGGSPLGSPDFDGDGIANRLDIDSDNDGIVDIIEAGGQDSNGDGRVDGTFVDQDHDGFSGIFDTNDGGSPLPVPNSDNSAGPDYLDTDSDNDSISDNVEGQPSAPGYIPPSGSDSDGDGLDNAYDTDNAGLPIVPVNTDSVGFPDYRDVDSDNDSILDSVEGTSDSDGDGVPNYRDLDSDGDGIPDAIEQTGNPDGDGLPNYLDPDSDNDGILDSVELYRDTDSDGVVDSQDLDSDNDGIFDSIETSVDSDGDGIGNYRDLDSDNDGVPDVVEAGGTDSNGDGLPDSRVDNDRDGILALFDLSEGGTPLLDRDADTDGVANRVDIDSDDDGIVDIIEAGGIDANGDGRVDGAFIDSDGDGYAALFDQNDGGLPLSVPDADLDLSPNYLDTDSDGDSITDNVEAQLHGSGYTAPSGSDADSDGLDDAYDISSGGTSLAPINTDGVGAPDYLDTDADNDTLLDSVEGTADADSDGVPNYRDLDSDGDGIPDVTEGAGNSDGDGSPNYLDTDSDNDGIPDSVERSIDSDHDGVPNSQDRDSDNDGVFDLIEGSGDADGDGVADYLDLDSDNDGIADVVEAGGSDSNGDGLPDSSADSDRDGILALFDSSEGGAPLNDRDSDGDGVSNRVDLDSDNDGIADILEAGGVDADGDGRVDGSFVDTDGDGYSAQFDRDDGGIPLVRLDADGDSTDNYLDVDSDGDSIADNVEGQPHGAGFNPALGLDTDGDGLDDAYDADDGGVPIVPVDTDGVGAPDYLDTDADNDSILDSVEGTGDADSDGTPNYRDLDSDGDGIADAVEGTQNADGDGSPNYLDGDSDNDGILDSTELTRDSDGDGVFDSQDLDSDNDGVFDSIEGSLDPDGDGVSSYRDLDSDNDGIADVVEAGGADANGDGLPDSTSDSDRDGILALFDTSEGGLPLVDRDRDGDGIPNREDLDSDNDGVVDIVEAGGQDVNGDGRVDGLFVDVDGDGFAGRFDSNDGGVPLGVEDADLDLAPNYLDSDSDGDNIGDNQEAQVDGLGFVLPSGGDNDGDGLDDAYDADDGGVPLVPVNTDGVGAPDYLDTDADNDGILDLVEGTSDSDSDGLPNYRDLDSDGDGVSDSVEGLGNTDGDGLPNYLDGDSDGDGIPDYFELARDTDGDGVLDFQDPDSDNDGVLDSIEGVGEPDGDGIPSYRDLDSDNDGIPDLVEAGGSDTDGDGLPDSPDSTIDSDHDGLLGIFDPNEGGFLLVDRDSDGDLVPNRLDLDSDDDGIVDLVEAGGIDANGNGQVDGTFVDSDGDGFSALHDSNDGGTPLPNEDADGDTVPNSLDSDSDGDGISDNVEGQPDGVAFTPALGLDTDGDGLDDAYDTNNGGYPVDPVNTDAVGAPDYVDSDADNDSLLDSEEGTIDSDGDGIPNYRDLDSDGDGIPDSLERSADQDGDSTPNYLDLDSDQDGIPDAVELSRNSDRDGVPDFLDLDSDNDGVFDTIEGASDPDGDGVASYRDLDSDNDGIADVVEAGGSDLNGDGSPDSAVDSDGDGILALFDVSEGGFALSDRDFDGEGVPNRVDLDSDNDGIVDILEAGGSDSDGNGRVDGAFVDSDGDGYASLFDSSDGGLSLPVGDADADSSPNYLDLDADGDGIPDNVEAQAHGSGFSSPVGLDSDGDGLDDSYDLDSGGSAIAPVNTDGVGAPDYLDTDADNDTLLDSVEGTADFDGDGTPNYRDLDSDGDGIPDAVEGGSDNDGDTDPNDLDLDSDGDTIPDVVEGQFDKDGDGIPNYRDIDSDNDGVLDRFEGTADKDGDGVANYFDLDSDNDGVPDIIEAGGIDANGDGRGDVPTDTDRDGWADLFDPSNGGTPLSDDDLDGDGLKNRLDLDADGDGVSDLIEAGGVDSDSNALVDLPFDDGDGDGYAGRYDTDDGGLPLTVPNTDGAGFADFLDTDSDDDLIPDNIEAQPHDVGYRAPSGSDSDNDGVDDVYDPSTGGSAIVLVNTDAVGAFDYRDTDSDNDGILDSIEGTADVDGDTIPNYRDLDSDGDGLLDSYEGNIDSDGDTVADYIDFDSDNDNILDSFEGSVDSDGDSIPDYRDIDSDNDGVLDLIETVQDFDGDGILNYLDHDSDNDGLADIVEAGGVDVDGDGAVDNVADTNGNGWANVFDFANGGTALADADTDGDTLADRIDRDSDGDGITDLREALGTDDDGNGIVDGVFVDDDGDGFSSTHDSDDGGIALLPPNTDGVDGPDHLDTDSDNDLILDNVEAQGDGSNYEMPLGVDVNGNGVDDAYDPATSGTPLVNLVNTDGTGLPDYRDTDADDDGIVDLIEGTADIDLDGIPNYRDLDSDGDGLLDSSESNVDTDGDGTPDYLDTDSDNDTIPDLIEGSADTDHDGYPDRLDLDSDNDGIEDAVELAGDNDKDGHSDYVDLDSDNDGIVDILEAGGVDANGDGHVDSAVDTDGDGLADIVDSDNGGTPLPSPDSDSDGRSDAVDIDSDGDGIPDLREAQTTSGYQSLSGTDTDSDGLDDRFDIDNGGVALVPINSDGLDGADYVDTDSDNDGVTDSIEGHDADANGVADVSSLSSDLDQDGLDDAYDTVSLVSIAQTWTNSAGSSAPLQDRDSDGAKDWRDADDDADGIATLAEDGDHNLNWANDDHDGDGTPDYLDLDSDNDGISNTIECLGQIPCADSDGDGVTNHLDKDSDNDGLPDDLETTIDSDRDGHPNYLDIDSDNDGIVDLVEAGGSDSDGNGRVDSVVDADGDGLVNLIDPDESGSALPNQDQDGDGKKNVLDIDADADGITDTVEAQSTAGFVAPSGLDSDADGLDDAYDVDNGGGAIVPVNTDGVLAPDYLDTDSENDGFVDSLEGHDANHNGVADVVPSGSDSDGDGLDNAFDTFDLLNPPSSGVNSVGSNSPLPDLDGDTIRDWRDADDDGDGIPTSVEGSVDTDGDQIPNAYDTDSDGDGAPDSSESGQDSDNDGIDDYLDPNCSLRFQVQLPSGEGLKDVSVTAPPSLSGVTNASGSATIPNVVNGTYQFNVSQPGGGIIGKPQVTVTNGSCGGVVLVEAKQVLENPVYFVWNGFYRQQNIAGALNKCDHPIGVEVTLIDLAGVEQSGQSVPLLAHSEYDVVANALRGYGSDTYGYIRVNYLEPDCAEGYAAHYRFSQDGSREEFSISKPFESVQRGRSFAEFNTMQPDPNPDKLDDESPHWVQIVNLHQSAFKNFRVIIRNLLGTIVSDETVVIGPRSRYDTQGGHGTPGRLQAGTIEVIPSDENAPFLAQLHNYNADGPVATLADTFSFASGITTRGGASYTQYVNISSGGGGLDWLVVSNLEDVTASYEIEFWANDGTLLRAETRTLSAREQEHIAASLVLRGSESGVVKIRPVGQAKIVAKNMVYFPGAGSRITAAYGVPSRAIYGGTLTGLYNTFLGTFNYLKLHNVLDQAVTATVRVYRVDGTLLGTRVISLAPHHGGDYELRVNLGMDVPADSYGSVEVQPSVSGSIYAELLRIRPGSAIDPVDLAQSLPVR